jgi:hypothetical protein
LWVKTRRRRIVESDQWAGAHDHSDQLYLRRELFVRDQYCKVGLVVLNRL